MEICLQVQTSLTQLQISSFHVVGRTRTAAKCSQLQFFNAINIVFLAVMCRGSLSSIFSHTGAFDSLAINFMCVGVRCSPIW